MGVIPRARRRRSRSPVAYRLRSARQAGLRGGHYRDDPRERAESPPGHVRQLREHDVAQEGRPDELTVVERRHDRGRRELEGAQEFVEFELPTVLTVDEGLNTQGEAFRYRLELYQAQTTAVGGR